MRSAGLLLATALLASACGGSDAAPGDDPSAASDVTLQLVKVATLEQPLALAVRPHDPKLYVAEKTGRVIAISGRQTRVVLDLTKKVSLGGEQGLLGLAFSPDGGELVVDYTDTDGNTRVVEYAFAAGRAVKLTKHQILFVEQPFANHNGGEVVFGPDGKLYIGLGDGGSGGDPLGNGQSLKTLLGKILRIDPVPGGPLAYTVPDDNPFVGDESARQEIWAYGLRNPWRFSFDRQTGDLWIGDVGQSAWEEVDRGPSGRGGLNFGWNAFEGDAVYDADTSAPDAVGPVYAYPHSGGGCVVTGGYVYRGKAIPSLRGTYVFGDFCMGELMGLTVENEEARVRSLGPSLSDLSSFGEDAAGEIYAMSLSGGVYRMAPASAA